MTSVVTSFEHLTRCVGLDNSGKTSVAKRLSGSTWPIDYTTPAITPYPAVGRWGGFIHHLYRGTSSSTKLYYKSNPKNSKLINCKQTLIDDNNNSKADINVEFTIQDPWNEAGIRACFQPNNPNLFTSNSNHTTRGTPLGSRNSRHRRYRTPLTRRHAYGNMYCINGEDGWKHQRYDDFQRISTLHSYLFVIDAKKIIDSYLRYYVEFNETWEFVEDYLNEIYHLKWSHVDFSSNNKIYIEESYKSKRSNFFTKFTNTDKNHVKKMRQLKQDLHKIGQEVMVIICLNKCDKMKNNENNVEKNNHDGVSCNFNNKHKDKQIDHDSDEKKTNVGHNNDHDSENESDNKNNESENREEACQEYIELKNLFAEKIEEWQKARWKEYQSNYGMHHAGHYKMPIETMIISAKTGYNLDNVLNKLAQFSNNRKQMCDEIIGDHLNNCDTGCVVFCNFVITICVLLGFVGFLVKSFVLQ